MGVKRLLIVATGILVSAMLFDGLYQKDSPLMWLASTDVNYAYMRVALIAVLIALFVSSPPRSVNFRLFLAVFAAALFGSTVWLSATYEINALDAIIFTEISIIFMIEALEANPESASYLDQNASSAS
jgi:hypothetical protein